MCPDECGASALLLLNQMRAWFTEIVFQKVRARYSIGENLEKIGKILKKVHNKRAQTHDLSE